MTSEPDNPVESADLQHMKAALALARRGLGRVWPNPAVGCVLVKDGHPIGRGWTQPGGRPHAETEALARAGDAARGATAYITLEPCAHHGATGPCAEALVAAGISRAVVAVRDPDPRVAGKGIGILRDAGIEVTEGVLQREALELNAGFISRIERGRPLVSLKVATSADQMIAAAPGQRSQITGPESADRSHLMRAEHDAILVGVETVLADDPQLTCRLPGMEDRSPVRIILDSREFSRIPDNAQVVRTAGEVPTWVFAGSAEGRCLEVEGLEVIRCKSLENLEELLVMLGRLGITRLLVEGGAKVHRSFLLSGLVDRVYWFRAPQAIGPGGLPAAGGMDLESLEKNGLFVKAGEEKLGKDTLVKLISKV